MSLELVFACFSGLISAIIAVAAYFIHKWIESVDGRLHSQKELIYQLRDQIEDTRIEPELLTTKILNRMKADPEFGLSQLAKITKIVNELNDYHTGVAIPLKRATDELKGKIIIIEDSLDGQDKKITTIVKHLARKKE